MDHSGAFKAALETLDVEGMRKLWAHVAPHLPQPNTDAEILATMHHARTQSRSMALKLRAYSHRWLVERGIPSGLPDELRQSAERMYPAVVQGVGISVNARSELLRSVLVPVRESMEQAVREAFADGRKEPAFVKQRMMEAREGTVQKLLGRRLGGT